MSFLLLPPTTFSPGWEGPDPLPSVSPHTANVPALAASWWLSVELTLVGKGLVFAEVQNWMY